MTPRGYAHAVAVSGPRRTLYLGGQDALDASGQLVGAGDLKAQTTQILANLEKILQAEGGGPEHVVKLNIHLVQGQNPGLGFQAFQERWGGRVVPAITVVFVAALGRPEWLAEIDGVAEIPEAGA
jgi:enamine deaminase RidA (YjgF/YER057c/UK114 family)